MEECGGEAHRVHWPDLAWLSLLGVCAYCALLQKGKKESKTIAGIYCGRVQIMPSLWPFTKEKRTTMLPAEGLLKRSAKKPQQVAFHTEPNEEGV